MLNACLGKRFGGFGSAQVSLRLSLTAGIEQSGIDGLDLGDDGLVSDHFVAYLGVDTTERPFEVVTPVVAEAASHTGRKQAGTTDARTTVHQRIDTGADLREQHRRNPGEVIDRDRAPASSNWISQPVSLQGNCF